MRLLNDQVPKGLGRCPNKQKQIFGGHAGSLFWAFVGTNARLLVRWRPSSLVKPQIIEIQDFSKIDNSQNRARWWWTSNVSGTEKQLRVWQAKRPACEGRFPSVSYDGEPSVSLGIRVPTSFVPPVHTPSTSEAPNRGQSPMVSIPCWLQLLFVDKDLTTCRWFQMALSRSADA